MPAPPLIRSERKRDRVIAIVMLLLLLASLGAAFGLTTQRHGRIVPTRSVTIQGLTIVIPETWQPVENDSAPAQVIQFRDTQRPTRLLTILPVTFPGPVPGPVLLPSLVEGMLRHDGAKAVQVGTDHGRLGDVLVTQWHGLGEPDAQGGQTVHIAANLTRDRRVHWMLYLTDRIAEDEPGRAVFIHSVGLMKNILRSATIADDAEPSDAAPDEPATPSPK